MPRFHAAAPGPPSCSHMPAVPYIVEGRATETRTCGEITIVCLWESRGAVR
jgi:hypothetical protein